MNIIKSGIGPYKNLNDDEFLQLILILAWNILKCLSYSLNYAELKNRKEENMNEIFYNWKIYCGYVFYFPTMIFGPCMIYDRYIKIEDKELEERFVELFKDIGKTLFWILFYNFALHFFYVHYLSYDVEV